MSLTVSDVADGGTSTFLDTVFVVENLHRLEIDITPDAFPQETSFAVLDANGDTLHTGDVKGWTSAFPPAACRVALRLWSRRLFHRRHV